MKRLNIVILSSLRAIVRGVAISALTRADTIKSYDIADESKVLTFDYCEDYDNITHHLKRANFLKQSVLINIFDYFSKNIHSFETTNKTSNIYKLLEKANIIKEEKYLKRCVKYTLADNRVVFEYFSKDEGLVYLRAISFGEAFLWDYTPEIELVNGDKLIQSFCSTRKFWSYFIENISNEVDSVHIFQDASYVEKGDTRDKFCAIVSGPKFYNYRIAHGATMTDIYKQEALPLLSWRNDEYWLDYSAIIFLTKNQKKQWTASQGEQGNLVVVPHESGRQELSYTERNGDRCVYITSLTKLKHVDIAIKAFAKVIQTFPKATLEIYGQGPEKEYLENLIIELKSEKNIILKGYKIDAQQYLEGAACSIFTSERESFGMPIVESYAYSCPVVAFDVNYGPNELIINGETGYKVEFGNIEELSVNILNILDSDTNYLRENAYLKSKNYEKETIAGLWHKVICDSEKRRSTDLT